MYHNIRDSKGRFTKTVNTVTVKTQSPHSCGTCSSTVARGKKNKAKPMQSVKLKNYVGIVLDESGSMYSVRQATMTAFDAIVQGLKDQANKTGIETVVSFVKFANRTDSKIENVPVNNVFNLRHYGYDPNGGTALFAAVEQIINQFKAVPDANDPNVSFLVYVITDGEDNQSRNKAPIVKSLLESTQATNRWSFGFQLPKGFANNFVRDFGIPRDNIREWEDTEVGMLKTQTATVQATQTYYSARSAGATSSVNLFTTDLSKVTARDIAAKLDDVSDHFKAYDVPSEQNAKEFVESKTKKSQVLGQLYYQLMKPEKLQPYKAIVLQEKGKKAIWAGVKAREILGLPNSDVKVIPGNHSNFDIFVQSASINRILPRGTKVLIDLKQTQPIKETWDSKAAEAVKQAKLAAAAI